MFENAARCIVCGNENNETLCSLCRRYISRAWCVGERSDVLKKLIDDYKFENTRAAHEVIAALLHDSLENLPSNTVVVPVPTIAAHIRQRGYDHTALVARNFARRRNLDYRPLLRRASHSSQRNATRTQRLAQAKTAFTAPTSLSGAVPYLVVDDIVTTGSTLTYAAKALHDAGAKEVWVAAVARQPLD